jgi:TolB-like protein/tRNA A-37 threonylcarbamoyl transferase component Bud32/Tfp pilus assembly protein PilF
MSHSLACMSLSAGTRLGPYEIAESIGAGGMGEVYRARDTRLGRDVAIKVIPPEFVRDPDRIKRFEQEARTAGALNHPNVCTVFDVGTHEGSPFVVMELLEGESLRDKLSSGPIPLRKALVYATQTAEGLAAAHEKGIVHRDLKPANVFVTKDGRAKVLDFGLAKLTLRGESGEDLAQSPTRTSDTLPGVVMGTIGYMSPEQVKGQPVDARSDLFSFGAILYEMLTGRRAFSGGSAAEVSSAILRDDPPPLTEESLPSALERVIQRCLEKSPDQRFQSARDLAFALGESASGSTVVPPARAGSRTRRPPYALLAGLLVVALAIALGMSGWLRGLLPATPGAAGIRSLAVLPLQNLTGDPGQDYLVDGMTDAVTTSLAQIGSVRVISRTSAMAYKGSKKRLPDVARELHVDAVVEGSVARSGERVRITAQLIRAKTDAHFWVRSFESPTADMLTLQGEVARAIADEVRAKLTADEKNRLTQEHRITARAYDAILRGRFALDQGTEAGMKEALEQFSRALEIQSDCAPAFAGIASYYATLPFFSTSSPAEVFPKARAAAEKSVELDDGLAEAHASLAYIRAYYEWDWTAAEREFHRALDLRPSFADAHFSYSRFLAASGRLEEAVSEIRKAEELDPQSTGLKANTALLSYFQGSYDDALTHLQEIAAGDSTLSTARWGIGLVYEAKGMGAEAVESLEKATKLSSSLNLQSSLAHAYARFGDPVRARRILSMLTERSRTSYVPSYFLAIVHVGLGEKDLAFEWLERAYQERSTVLAYLRIDPRLAPLRSDPRYAELVRRLGFPTAVGVR